MEAIASLIITCGVVYILVILVAAVVELISARKIKTPPEKTFTYIHLQAQQERSIVIPALLALFSGLLVSISSSFMFAGFVDTSRSYYQLIGFAIFITTVIVLVLALRSITRDVGEPGESIEDPSSIRAAADAICDAPGVVSFTPEHLEDKLADWETRAAEHAFHVNPKSKPLAAKKSLESTRVRKKGFTVLKDGLQLFFLLTCRYPSQALFPAAGPILVTLGIILFQWQTLVHPASDWPQWGRNVALVMMTLTLSSALMAPYCYAIGNSAYLRFMVNKNEAEKARELIKIAGHAHAEHLKDLEKNQKLLDFVDEFTSTRSEENPQNPDIKIGRLAIWFKVVKKTNSGI